MAYKKLVGVDAPSPAQLWASSTRQLKTVSVIRKVFRFFQAKVRGG